MPPKDVWVIPSFLSTKGLIILFAVSLVLFHWILVYVRPLDKLKLKPLGKRGWKIVDYIWVSAGAIAISGTLFQARQLLATGMLHQLEPMVESSVDDAQFYSNPDWYNGLLCRKFVRSADSPPEEEFNKTAKEYDDACAWAHQMTEHLKGIDRWTLIDVPTLPKAPDSRGPGISGVEKEMLDAIATHNEFVRRREALQQAAERSDLERFLAMIAPVLAVLATALRLTKVTGELRLE
jgi:hypothetical protein